MATRKRWGWKERATGKIWLSTTRRVALALAMYNNGELVGSEWLGPDYGWTEWAVAR